MIFGSDNQSGASPQIMEALLAANSGYAHGYGDDPWTHQAVEALKKIFDCDLDVFFVSTGTVANCLAMACLARPWQTVLCQSTSHLINDESTAPEFFTGGARAVGLSKDNGKLNVAELEATLQQSGIHLPHNPQAAALSLTQSSELGLVYTPAEIKRISEVCKRYQLKFHMDGARFANAVAALNCTPAALTWQAGVDVLSLGATKCGAVCAEAVIFFDKTLAKDFEHHRKRAGQLASKGRFFGVQFLAWLENQHWLKLAQHANQQAAKLAEGLTTAASIRLAYPVEANQVFLSLPKQLAQQLRDSGAEFYDWYPSALPAEFALKPEEDFIRLVTSFATTDNDCNKLIELATQYTRIV